MKMNFDAAGNMISTDYWSSDSGCLSRATWAAVRDGVWHLLMPSSGVLQHAQLIAMPVIARSEPDGWQWSLFSPDRAINCRIPLRNFVGSIPPLPQRGAKLFRKAFVYGMWQAHLNHVTYNFGHFTMGKVPVEYECHLQVTRPLLPSQP